MDGSGAYAPLIQEERQAFFDYLPNNSSTFFFCFIFFRIFATGSGRNPD